MSWEDGETLWENDLPVVAVQARHEPAMMRTVSRSSDSTVTESPRRHRLVAVGEAKSVASLEAAMEGLGRTRSGFASLRA